MLVNSILVVGSDLPLLARLGKALEPLGNVSFANTVNAALQRMLEQAPDLVLLDAEMSDVDGMAVCDAMNRTPGLESIPVIFMTAQQDSSAENRCLSAGAVDVISHPIHDSLLLARAGTQLKLKRLTDDLRRRAAIHPLTGLSNRGYFQQRLRLEWARATRNENWLSLLLLDIDHFKSFNDRYGHPAGDACLRAIGDALSLQTLRATDLAAYTGADAFALLLPETDAAGAGAAAARVRRAVARLDIPHAASATASFLTVSIGAATRRPTGPFRADDALDFLTEANQALCAAKPKSGTSGAVARAANLRPGASPTPKASD